MTVVPRLAAMAVATHPHSRISKRWHVADVKNIAGNDQATLMVHRDPANIACTFRFYVYLRLRDRDCCSTADGNGSCHAPTLSYFEEMTRCRHQRLPWRWPSNPNGRSKFHTLRLLTFSGSQQTLRRQLRGWWRLPEIAEMAHSRREKLRREWPGSIEITQIRKFMPTRSIKTSRKTSFCCYERRRHWLHCAVFILLSLATAFVLIYEKLFFNDLDPHQKTEIYIL